MKIKELKSLLEMYGSASSEMLFREHRILTREIILDKSKVIVGQKEKTNKKIQFAERLIAHERRRRAEHLGQ